MCRPHVGPSASTSLGRLSLDLRMSVIWSQLAPPTVWHFAVNRSGYLTQGVAASGGTVNENGTVRRCAGKYVSSDPEPPARAAGFVQSTWSPGLRARAKRLFGGGVWSNDENAITQPTCDALWHAPKCWKSPPTSLPVGTITSPPSRIAETILAPIDRSGPLY